METLFHNWNDKKQKKNLSKGNFKDKEVFVKLEIGAYCTVWCNNFLYLHKFYDVHLWASNLSGKAIF